MKWARKRNGSWELREGDLLHAVMEPAIARGHWWWTTWGMRPDAGGYAFSGPDPISVPGRRRIYSNTGIEMAAAAVAGDSRDPGLLAAVTGLSLLTVGESLAAAQGAALLHERVFAHDLVREALLRSLHAAQPA